MCISVFLNIKGIYTSKVASNKIQRFGELRVAGNLKFNEPQLTLYSVGPICVRAAGLA